MSSTEAAIDLDVPVERAYSAWADLTHLPDRLSMVDEIRTTDGEVSHWKVSLGPIEREFDARVTEVIPEKRIAWKSVTGADHAGVVTFHHLDERRSRMTLQMDFDPDGFLERAADALNIVESMANYDLGAFKAWIEEREHPQH